MGEYCVQADKDRVETTVWGLKHVCQHGKRMEVDDGPMACQTQTESMIEYLPAQVNPE